MNMPVQPQQPTPAEQNAITGARTNSEQCACGQPHTDGHAVTPATVARMKGYVAAHPGHQFAIDEEAGIIAVITGSDAGCPGQPQVIASSTDLADLLDAIDAPASAELS